ncbi:RND family transporter [Aquimonas sp.]|jgi:predicted RND superfamily exporter protein|uniref:efflux RND transporter permease subunit n=1 Tax=Aquimonas sp. TaxID=1872588 RepID=UPI0037BF9C73
MLTTMRALWRASIHHPWRVFLLCALISVVALLQFPQVRIDTDPENMLPADQPERVFHNAVKQRFALHDAIVVGVVASGDSLYSVRSLTALHALSAAVQKLDGVIAIDQMSLAEVDNVTQAGPGTLRFEWLMRAPPADAAAAQAIRAAVERLPLAWGTLASEDGRAAALYVPIIDKNLSHRIAGEIRQLIATLDTDDRFHITGLPVAEDTFGYEMFVQMAICAPLAGLVIFLLMWGFFRSALFVTGPMLVAMGSVIVTMGALIGMGFSVHIMSSMIAIFLMPIAVVDAIHIQSDFAERYRPGMDAGEVMDAVLDELFRPMLFTTLTSAVGFASLLLTPIPPVQIFGAFVAFGILLAFVLTMTLLPAFVARLPGSALATLARTDTRASRLYAPLARIHALSQRQRPLILLIALAAAVVSALGIGRIEVNDNPVRWFKASHEIRVADRELNAHFAGTYDAYLVLEQNSAAVRAGVVDDWRALPASPLRDRVLGAVEAEPALDRALRAAQEIVDGAEDFAEAEAWTTRIENAQRQLALFQQPEVLREVEALQRALDGSGLVGKSNALTDIVKTVYRELRGGDLAEQRIPDSQAGVAQTLLQFQSSHRPQDLWHFTTPDYSSAVVWLQLKSGDNQDMRRVEDFVAEYLTAHPLPAGLTARWAGKAHLNGVWQAEMVHGMAWSLAGAWVAVLLMMVLLFRSLPLGLLAMLPLTLSIGVLYGLIGWLGKDYDMPIAVLSALALGLAVDFAIHFIERARGLYRELGDVDATLAALFREPALAISRNAIVIAVGFTPLLFAPLVPYITVGWLLAGIMALSALVTLFLLAALLGAGNGWLLRRVMR